MITALRMFNSTRIGAILQTLLYVSGLPYFSEKYSIFQGIQSRVGGEIYHGPHPYDPTNTFCYGELGCVTLKYSRERGFHLFPLSVEQIQPFVCLYTRESRLPGHLFRKAKQTCQNVDRDSLADLHLGRRNSTVIWIAHGYLENSATPWMQDMVRELLAYDEDLNVFVVDWGGGANPPYNQAVSNLPLVAAYLGDLMMLLQEVYELKIGHIHFIGHSLGSHLAGLTGAWLRENHDEVLGRISGLDPAQPYFQKYPPDARLDPSDARLVDVIHTDAKPMLKSGFNGLGIEDPIGHADFYPNNGRDQPGCDEPLYRSVVKERGSLMRGLKRMVGCDHMRSFEYFIESIRSSCSFTAYACPSWSSFLSSACNASCDGNGSCLRMGYHTWGDAGHFTGPGLNATASASPSSLANRTDVEETTAKDYFHNSIDKYNYYLITGNKMPFCLCASLCRFHGNDRQAVAQFFSKVRFNLIFKQRRAFPYTVALEERDLKKSFYQHYLVADSNLVTGETTEIELEVVPALSVRWLITRKATDIKIRSVEINILDRRQRLLFCRKEKMVDKVDKETKLFVGAC